MKIQPTKIGGVRFWLVINREGVTVGTFQSVVTARWYADEIESGAFNLL